MFTDNKNFKTSNIVNTKTHKNTFKFLKHSFLAVCHFQSKLLCIIIIEFVIINN